MCLAVEGAGLMLLPDMIVVANLPRRSLQIDSNFGYLNEIDPWPRYHESQDRLLASDKLNENEKQKLRNWIDGLPIKSC